MLSDTQVDNELKAFATATGNQHLLDAINRDAATEAPAPEPSTIKLDTLSAKSVQSMAVKCAQMEPTQMISIDTGNDKEAWRLPASVAVVLAMALNC